MIDIEKFRQSQSRGIFDNGEDYQKWSVWARMIEGKIAAIKIDNQYISSPTTDKQYDKVFCKCTMKIESAIHVIIHDMSHNGASWIHLGLLNRLIDEQVVPPHHAGRFYLQISDWYIWYCKQLGFE